MKKPKEPNVVFSYHTGDLVEEYIKNGGCVAHGVNCQGQMNSGFAAAVKEKLPRIRQIYLDYFDKNVLNISQGDQWLTYLESSKQPYRHHQARLIFERKRELLGKIIPCVEKKGAFFHCFTQFYYGKDGKTYVDYNAVRHCMLSLFRNTLVMNMGLKMPRIGCGLAGGKWEKIEEEIICAANYCKPKKPFQVQVWDLK